ncbi:hypothetical protein [Rhizobium sp. AG855]|uniref:hypothetical protein n=1 Tax=Rhizobium sp. AG855 TaxID=2183898 RepID=UPI000E770D6C|nr:hypothetical protein [Rhizobium sp. AG855]RKE86277.1 hypothetical protein DFO46_3086 [Rhizobium sp. AG855]
MNNLIGNAMKFDALFDHLGHGSLSNQPNLIQWSTRLPHPIQKTLFLWTASSEMAGHMNLHILDEADPYQPRSRVINEPVQGLFAMIPPGMVELPDWCEIDVIYDGADNVSYTWAKVRLDREFEPKDVDCPLIVSKAADGWCQFVENDARGTHGDLTNQHIWKDLLSRAGIDIAVEAR